MERQASMWIWSALSFEGEGKENESERGDESDFDPIPAKPVLEEGRTQAAEPRADF